MRIQVRDHLGIGLQAFPEDVILHDLLRVFGLALF